MGVRVVLLLALLAWPLAAASLEPAAVQDARARMAPLGKLVGEWKGGGWILQPGGREKATFTGEERVEARLESGALLVEGLHRGPDGAVVHQTLGVLAWDGHRKEYRFATAIAGGTTGYHAGRLEPGRFVWTLDARGPPRRFIISLEGDHAWEEWGEVSLDGGKTWRRFMEMKLTRVR